MAKGLRHASGPIHSHHAPIAFIVNSREQCLGYKFDRQFIGEF